MMRGLLTHRPAEELGQHRIKGGASLLVDLLQGFMGGERGSSWFFSGEVVECLGDVDNASEQRRAFFT